MVLTVTCVPRAVRPAQTGLCAHCNEPLPLLTVPRVISNGLIYTFYANRTGITIGADYTDVFKWLAMLRPYRGPRDVRGGVRG